MPYSADIKLNPKVFRGVTIFFTVPSMMSKALGIITVELVISEKSMCYNGWDYFF